MAIHSYVQVWVHMVWGTYKHIPVLHRDLRLKLFDHLVERADQIDVTLEKLNVQPEHVHMLYSLPSDKTLGQIAKLFKGESSIWISNAGLIKPEFQWSRGYGAFSVSDSIVETVKHYIRTQDKHHNTQNFTDEYIGWAKRYGVYDD
ncbi:MAG: IS200/IS605 family transposase [Bacteroidales bacterium]|nr:IS200/IS605 family transposase [Bacteroidales bacterium]MCF8455657.1 IS200/IS605 family transposase [Bacteroidales bacterium]